MGKSTLRGVLKDTMSLPQHQRMQGRVLNSIITGRTIGGFGFANVTFDWHADVESEDGL
jgi:hypothetical protein